MSGIVNFFAFVVCACLLLLSITSTHAESQDRILEYKVKAAYLYNFTKFIKWPENALDPEGRQAMRICILGVDPFGHSVDLLTNKTVQGHPVEIVYIQEPDPEQDCHVLFISRSKAKRVKQILDAVSGKSILTVSDIEGFSQKGGCITLTVIDGKVRFNVNISSTRRANLDMSAKLLELARTVIE